MTVDPTLQPLIESRENFVNKMTRLLVSEFVKTCNELIIDPACVIMLSAFTEGSVDINLTPDKRQVLIEKESQIWDALKERLKEIFDKIAPPETGSMNNLDSNKLTNYFEEVKVPGESGDSVENKTRGPQNRDLENVEDNFSLSEFKAKLANSKRSQTSCKTGKSTKSR